MGGFLDVIGEVSAVTCENCAKYIGDRDASMRITGNGKSFCSIACREAYERKHGSGSDDSSGDDEDDRTGNMADIVAQSDQARDAREAELTQKAANLRTEADAFAFMRDVYDYEIHYIPQHAPQSVMTRNVWHAIVKNPHGSSYLANMPEQYKTPDICLTAVKNTSFTLEYVPEKLKTPEMCLWAAINNGIDYIPAALLTAEILALVKKDNPSLYKTWEKDHRNLAQQAQTQHSPPDALAAFKAAGNMTASDPTPKIKASVASGPANKVVDGLLCFFFGFFGIHLFYRKRKVVGALRVTIALAGFLIASYTANGVFILPALFLWVWDFLQLFGLGSKLFSAIKDRLRK